MATGSETDVNLEGESAFMTLFGLELRGDGPGAGRRLLRAGRRSPPTLGAFVHGGVFTAVIETAATTGAYQPVKDRSQLAVGVNNVTDFLRPHQQGRLRVFAEPLHQGKSQQFWQVIVEREDGKTVARGQVRLQNVEADA